MPTPIFQLVKQIEDDDIGLRAIQLITKLGAKTVEDLAQYSPKYLRSQTAEGETVVAALGEILSTKYHVNFSETYR